MSQYQFFRDNFGPLSESQTECETVVSDSIHVLNKYTLQFIHHSSLKTLSKSRSRKDPTRIFLDTSFPLHRSDDSGSTHPLCVRVLMHCSLPVLQQSFFLWATYNLIGVSVQLIQSWKCFHLSSNYFKVNFIGPVQLEHFHLQFSYLVQFWQKWSRSVFEYKTEELFLLILLETDTHNRQLPQINQLTYTGKVEQM